MKIEIREAQKQDCARILELVQELATYERAPDEVTVSLAHFEEMGFGSNPIWWAFVAEVDGHIQGFALYYIRYSTWKGARLYLEDFYVTENYRKYGLGKLLFEKTIQACKKGNYNGMVWQVLDWNTLALQFYKKYNAEVEAGWLNASLSQEFVQTFES